MKRILQAISSASRELFRRRGALLILLVLDLAMLGAVYLFFVTREATIGQLLLSALLALAAPLLFLVIQTMAARYDQGRQRAWGLLGGSLRDFWKLLVISVPLILITILAVYLFGKIETAAPAAAVRDAVRAVPTPIRAATTKSQPIHWQSVVLVTLQYLLYCLILPLAAVHLWIATAREGLKQAFKRSLRILGHGFAPQSVITYAIGFVFFAVVPYFLVVTKTSAASPWVDVTLLAGRLLLAAVFSLIGWVVTVGALGGLSGTKASERVAQTDGGTVHVPAEA